MQTSPDNYESDPNFATVLSFLEKFGSLLDSNYSNLTIDDLKAFLETKEVQDNDVILNLHIRLLKNIGKKNCKEWTQNLMKFCQEFPEQDDHLIDRVGYENLPIFVKIRILKNLCEEQFEHNERFNQRVNEQLETGDTIRHEPAGRDSHGRTYWCTRDQSGDSRVYRSYRDEATFVERWALVCSGEHEMKQLIEDLEEKADGGKDELEQTDEDDPLLPRSRTFAEISAEESSHGITRHCRVDVKKLSRDRGLIDKYLDKEDIERYGLEEGWSDSSEDDSGISEHEEEGRKPDAATKRFQKKCAALRKQLDALKRCGGPLASRKDKNEDSEKSANNCENSCIRSQDKSSNCSVFRDERNRGNEPTKSRDNDSVESANRKEGPRNSIDCKKPVGVTLVQSTVSTSDMGISRKQPVVILSKLSPKQVKQIKSDRTRVLKLSKDDLLNVTCKLDLDKKIEHDCLGKDLKETVKTEVNTKSDTAEHKSESSIKLDSEMNIIDKSEVSMKVVNGFTDKNLRIETVKVDSRKPVENELAHTDRLRNKVNLTSAAKCNCKGGGDRLPKTDSFCRFCSEFMVDMENDLKSKVEAFDSAVTGEVDLLLDDVMKKGYRARRSKNMSKDSCEKVIADAQNIVKTKGVIDIDEKGDACSATKGTSANRTVELAETMETKIQEGSDEVEQSKMGVDNTSNDSTSNQPIRTSANSHKGNRRVDKDVNTPSNCSDQESSSIDEALKQLIELQEMGMGSPTSSETVQLSVPSTKGQVVNNNSTCASGQGHLAINSLPSDEGCSTSTATDPSQCSSVNRQTKATSSALDTDNSASDDLDNDLGEDDRKADAKSMELRSGRSVEGSDQGRMVWSDSEHNYCDSGKDLEPMDTEDNDDDFEEILDNNSDKSSDDYTVESVKSEKTAETAEAVIDVDVDELVVGKAGTVDDNESNSKPTISVKDNVDDDVKAMRELYAADSVPSGTKKTENLHERSSNKEETWATNTLEIVLKNANDGLIEGNTCQPLAQSAVGNNKGKRTRAHNCHKGSVFGYSTVETIQLNTKSLALKAALASKNKIFVDKHPESDVIADILRQQHKTISDNKQQIIEKFTVAPKTNSEEKSSSSKPSDPISASVNQKTFMTFSQIQSGGAQQIPPAPTGIPLVLLPVSPPPIVVIPPTTVALRDRVKGPIRSFIDTPRSTSDRPIRSFIDIPKSTSEPSQPITQILLLPMNSTIVANSTPPLNTVTVTTASKPVARILPKGQPEILIIPSSFATSNTMPPVSSQCSKPAVKAVAASAPNPVVPTSMPIFITLPFSSTNQATSVSQANLVKPISKAATSATKATETWSPASLTKSSGPDGVRNMPTLNAILTTREMPSTSISMLSKPSSSLSVSKPKVVHMLGPKGKVIGTVPNIRILPKKDKTQPAITTNTSSVQTNTQNTHFASSQTVVRTGTALKLDNKPLSNKKKLYTDQSLETMIKEMNRKKRGRPRKHVAESSSSSSSDSEFNELLESGSEKSEKERDSDGCEDDVLFYDTLSRRLKQPGAKQSSQDGSKDGDTDTDSDGTTKVGQMSLGRNAKRAAARGCLNYAEPADILIEETSSDEVEDEAERARLDQKKEEEYARLLGGCCDVCGEGNKPYTILLCDRCDSEYHMTCLRPPLHLVPLEDWFCPVCEQVMLIDNLRTCLQENRKMRYRYKRKHGNKSWRPSGGVSYKKEANGDRSQDESGQDQAFKISQAAFCINPDNIVEPKGRSCRTKVVSYNEKDIDKQMNNVVKNVKESGRKKTKSEKRKSRQDKKKRPKLEYHDNSSDNSSEGNESDYKCNSSSNSDTSDEEGDTSDLKVAPSARGKESYFTTSGRRTKNVSYVD